MAEGAPSAGQTTGESSGSRANRELALRVGKWLVDKSRFDEAVALMAVYAVSGPNDDLGQKLLAEAFQIDSASTLAKAAFGRMESLSAPDADLDAAIATYTHDALSKLEGEMKRPQFLRAQVGFNNNLKYKGHDYHVQTEDSGLNKPHIITHLFADGGRVIKSNKRIYKKELERPDIVQFVRTLMKGQHMEMVLALREGKFDLIIAGKAPGGMTTLEEPPNVDVQKMNSRKRRDSVVPPAAAEPAPVVVKSAVTIAPPPIAIASDAPVVRSADAASRPASTPPVAPPVAAAVEDDAADSIPAPAIRFHLRVLRAAPGTPTFYSAPGDEVTVGAHGQVPLHHDRFVHPTEAVFHWRDGALWLEDLEGGNGCFIRIKSPMEVEIGDEFIVGDQLLRVERNPPRHNEPGPGPTYFWSSPMGPSAFRVVQVLAGGASGETRIAGGTTISIGSAVGELLLNDPLVSEQHCFIEEQAGAIILSDLDSKSGVFVRIRGEAAIHSGDELVFGRTRVRVELPLA